MELIYSILNQGFYSIVPFVILLGFLIFVHELGHFLVAIWCGVRVETFSLGFGKKIFQKKVGDTTYCISLIPLGGYVKMFGDEIGAEIPTEEKKFSFTHKNVWQRIAVVLAGPMMNFFFAILIFSIVAVIGEEVRSTKAGDIPADSIAFQSGFRSGDTILTIDGAAVKTWDEFQSYINTHHDRSISVEVLREGTDKKESLHATASLKPNSSPVSLDDFIGEIEGLSHTSMAAAVGVIKNSTAEKLGLQTGDRITHINGKEISYYRELEPTLQNLSNQKIEFKIERFLLKSKSNSAESQQLKIDFDLGKFQSLIKFGIESSDLYLSKVMDGTPAAEAGLQMNDRITRLNTLVPKKWEDILNAVKSYDGTNPLKIVALHDGIEKIFEVTPRLTSQMTAHGTKEERFTIGISPWVMTAIPTTLKISTTNPLKALYRGYEKTREWTALTVVSFLRLVQNKISPKNLGGVISISQAASETFKTSITHFLQLMAILSVNLFILNLLPIPVLDGGHLLFYTIEALRGAPLSMRKLEIAQQVGLVVLMSLMALSLFNDVSRILGF